MLFRAASSAPSKAALVFARRESGLALESTAERAEIVVADAFADAVYLQPLRLQQPLIVWPEADWTSLPSSDSMRHCSCSDVLRLRVRRPAAMRFAAVKTSTEPATLDASMPS